MESLPIDLELDFLELDLLTDGHECAHCENIDIKDLFGSRNAQCPLIRIWQACVHWAVPDLVELSSIEGVAARGTDWVAINDEYVELFQIDCRLVHNHHALWLTSNRYFSINYMRSSSTTGKDTPWIHRFTIHLRKDR
jgi:hypothetical protein